MFCIFDLFECAFFISRELRCVCLAVKSATESAHGIRNAANCGLRTANCGSCDCGTLCWCVCAPSTTEKQHSQHFGVLTFSMGAWWIPGPVGDLCNAHQCTDDTGRRNPPRSEAAARGVAMTKVQPRSFSPHTQHTRGQSHHAASLAHAQARRQGAVCECAC